MMEDENKKKVYTEVVDGEKYLCIDTECIRYEQNKETKDLRLEVKDECDNPEVVEVFSSMAMDNWEAGGKVKLSVPKKFKHVAEDAAEERGLELTEDEDDSDEDEH